MNVTRLNLTRGLEWRQRFAVSLIKLVPQLNPDAADELSDSQFLESAGGTEPDEAAFDYAASHGWCPSDRPAPPRRTGSGG
ncbi:MAG: hypothetical protein JSR59_08220 [Proteobacteria bacterium]|nr:hypothetical protein [Pseudomonadota bacterium]